MIPIHTFGCRSICILHAILCWLAFRNKYFPGGYLLRIAVYAAYAIYKFFDQNGVWDWMTKHHATNIAGTMKAEQPLDRRNERVFWIGDTYRSATN